MNIIHVAWYKDEFFNGIKSVLIELVPEQRAQGNNVYVFNLEQNEKEIIPGEIFIQSTTDFITHVTDIKPDLVIFHSLYGLSPVKFSWFLNSNHIPYVVEPHGGTSIENSKKSWLKKKIANVLYTNRFIRKAAGLIYLNQKEQEECVFKKIRKNYAIIPNGTHLHTQNTKLIRDDIIRFIFLARIDIIQKGLDLLFPAIKAFNKKGYQSKTEFHFYGKARNPKYAQEFENYISNADDNVFFHGSVIGMDKDNAYENADIFILTSRYEGMPMAVLEALSHGCPCIVTPQTNMAEIIKKHDAGWVTSTDIDSIVETLSKACVDYLSKYNHYYNNTTEAIHQFSWDAIANKSIQEYTKLINSYR